MFSEKRNPDSFICKMIRYNPVSLLLWFLISKEVRLDSSVLAKNKCLFFWQGVLCFMFGMLLLWF